ncbi:response regulator [Devosia faecipullorum]|uniref:response regulator n=1 Tax=Devosia faecipullorum TaxID=2755039 RepID=UPI00187B7580|nr:response regulator [Devosia faecipullorum]MBE7732856.1 response regulator [Devosia faecipullorum]
MTPRLSILIVDDHFAVRQSLAISVAASGWHVETAESGEAALQMLASRTFDVLLTDLWMPGVDGVALIKACRQSQPDLKVFGMTGGGPGISTEAMLTLAEIWGARQVFYKPFDDATLIAALTAPNPA